MPVLVVVAVVLGTLYLARTWKKSGRAAVAQRLTSMVRWARAGALAVLALAVLAAMAQGCDDDDRSSGGPGEQQGPPCTAYRAEDCVPGGDVPTTTTTAQPAGPDLEEPRYVPCPAFHEEDCPLAPPEGP